MNWMLLLVSLVAGEANPAYRSEPKTPEETLKSFELYPGLEIEVAAAEPLIVDPVAITFDDKGRLYVVEYRDYPLGPGKGKPPLSRIKLLHDDDGDGRYDRATIFADNISFAQGLLAYRDGLLVTAAPDVLYLKDTDGDGKADVREVLFTGFKPGNPQLRTAHPRWGQDNWIYMTNGLSGGQVTSPKRPGEVVNIDRFDFRFDPRTGDFEPATGKGQFGNTFDDWGNRFVCTNRNPCIHVVLPYRALVRNPYAVITADSHDVAPFGGDAKVYPIAETNTTAYEHSGTNTAACGVHVYRGDLLGPDFSNNVFVCEPTGYLVTRYKLVPDGVTFRAVRDRPKTEFLASRDQWFRPVSLADGPDGALYVVDMYREVIEHPQYMPKGLPEKLRLRAGDDRGRIYRIKPKGAKARPYTPPKTTKDAVDLLADPNGWRRIVGQRLLVERQDKDAAPGLRIMLAINGNLLARAHALWTLEGTGSLLAPDVERALADPDPRVQEQGVRLAGRHLEHNPQMLGEIERLAAKRSPRLRFEIALALADVPGLVGAHHLLMTVTSDAIDPWVGSAVLSSSRDRAGVVLAGMYPDFEYRATRTQAQLDLVSKLSEVVGARGNEAEIAKLLDITDIASPRWQGIALAGLAQGLSRQRAANVPSSLSALVERPPEGLKPYAGKIAKMLRRAADLAKKSNEDESMRTAAIRVLGFGPADQALKVLPALLSGTESEAIQLACIEAMRTTGSEAVAPILLANWPSLRPAARAAALDLLMARPASRLATLQAMADGKADRSAVSLEMRTRLLADGDGKIKALATSLFGGPVSANRAAVIDRYKSALALKADAGEGRKAFRKVCISCHKLDGEGHEVGPDISDVRNKTKETLLSDILDPNRAVEPRWVEYTVATADGRVLTGLFVREAGDAVVLRKAEGKEEIIPRSQIETIRASGKSLMPEGVEKDLTVQQLADLLKYLKNRR